MITDPQIRERHINDRPLTGLSDDELAVLRKLPYVFHPSSVRAAVGRQGVDHLQALACLADREQGERTADAARARARQ